MAANVFHRNGKYFIMVFVRRADSERIFLHNVLPLIVLRRHHFVYSVKSVLTKVLAYYNRRPDLKVCHIGIRYENDRQARFYKPSGRPL